VRDDITEWGRNLQNKTLYKFACNGQRQGGMEDDCIGIQISQRTVVFGRRRTRRRKRPFTFFSPIHTSKRVKRFLYKPGQALRVP
jgi:hypothetical protein